MNLAEAAELVLLFKINDQVSSGLRTMQGALDTTNTKGATLQGGLTKIGQGLGVGIANTAKIGVVGLGALWTQVDAGIDSLAELEEVTAQTEAVIESTGGAAGLTADDIRTYAQELEELTGVDDKVIQSGQNVLLTFTNIKTGAFEPATQAALDMSTAMGTDLQGSIVQVGKALNDPIAGITALSRVGVTFTEDQKKVIETLVETGDTAGAQKIILDELNKEFGGSAQAQMEGYRGTQKRLADTWEGLQQTLAEALLPALNRLATVLNEKLNDPSVREGVRKIGEALAGLFSESNIQTGTDAIKEVFNFLKNLPWDSIKSGLQFAADNAKKVVDVFRSLPPGVQAGLLTFLAANKLTGGLVASGLGELAKVALSSLRTITAASVTVVGPITGGPGGGGGGTAGGGGGGGGLIMKVAGLAGIAALPIIVKGDSPVPVSANQLEQQGRDLFGAFQGVNSSIERDLLGFLRSDGDRQALVGQRGAIATELVKNAVQQGTTVEALYGRETGQKISNLAREQSVKLQGSITATNAVKNQVQLGLDAAKARIEQTNRTQAQALSALHESRERLGNISSATQRTANKDYSVTVNTHTTLNVSGRKVAEALERDRVIQGGIGGWQ